ncbi:uncharacterized protein B0I36DRAFT_356351 [Microdochium trichocladiopsis]|uniref:Uncharacterized protein n=1 Tax=Microdochium trichocladiopsis TaxID=1682393 RepID=A0A9P8XR50_9PEZI|nr:uncharacterized protein B0I36DRAFT_356351 [Microdochium trichocladiopsis]KAH7012281.1 hypothetical protein B0I36DRAFT_356351 [Microdochium trichocladiopsis]
MRSIHLDEHEFELDEGPQECAEFDDPLVPASSDVGFVSGLRYNIMWKLHLRKVRLTMITKDTIENGDVANGAYWNQVLESELLTIVTSRAPAPDYSRHAPCAMNTLHVHLKARLQIRRDEDRGVHFQTRRAGRLEALQCSKH